jgi:hypothetical protein
MDSRIKNVLVAAPVIFFKMLGELKKQGFSIEILPRNPISPLY